jgi:hypothetical protein
MLEGVETDRTPRRSSTAKSIVELPKVPRLFHSKARTLGIRERKKLADGSSIDAVSERSADGSRLLSPIRILHARMITARARRKLQPAPRLPPPKSGASPARDPLRRHRKTIQNAAAGKSAALASRASWSGRERGKVERAQRDR